MVDYFQMDGRVFEHKNYGAAESHDNDAIEREDQSHHCLPEAKLRKVISPAVPVDWNTSGVVVVLQCIVVELFMELPVLLKQIYEYGKYNIIIILTFSSFGILLKSLQMF